MAESGSIGEKMSTTTMYKFIENYFNDSDQYPSPPETMLPLGTVYDFISSTFLNGWINYLEIVSAQLISRYQDYSTNCSRLESLLIKPESHSNFGESLGDDVIILAKTKKPHMSAKSCVLCGNPDSLESKEEYTWWFFYYDRDCSDSSIGRFETDDSDEEIINSFKCYANDRSLEESGHPSIEIPLKIFRGWISG
jgi:hypothetical protein